MLKNITLRLDEGVLKEAKRAALEADQSVSQWVADRIAEAVLKRSQRATARRRVLEVLDKTFHLGGKPLTRDEIYAERTRLR
jgi:hypothetical protein